MSTDRLQKAKISLTLDVPFWAQLSFKLAHNLDESVPTACTDGRVVRYSPNYLAKITDAEIVGLMIEEVGHCAMGHLWRRGTREMKRWNQACDQVLWTIIAELQVSTGGRVALSKDCKIEPRFKGLSAEEIYHLLSLENSSQSYQSPGEFGEPAPDGQPSESPEQGDSPTDGIGPQSPSLEQDWQAATLAAATVEKQRTQGNLPAWLKHIVTDLTEPRVPWTEHVREFCHTLSRDDYSFNRPNRRYLGSGFILPSLRSERLGAIVGAFDTSGSIFAFPDMVRDILSEFQAVLDHCRPTEMRMIDCDTQVHQQAIYQPGDDLRTFVPQGGGGTDFRPVFDAIEALGEEPACLIFLTDLYGTFPATPPPYPVLWANFGNPKNSAPFGKTIHVPIA